MTYRVLAAILLVLVGYIHLTLFFEMISFNKLMGVLFILNAVGALVALIAILVNVRWWIGWGLGILVAGGAFVIKGLMTLFPSVEHALLGGGAGFGHPGAFAGHFPGKKFPGGKFSKGSFPKNGYPGHFLHHGAVHTVLPNLFGHSAGPVSLVIEGLFVLLAVWVLVQKRHASSAPVSPPKAS